MLPTEFFADSIFACSLFIQGVEIDCNLESLESFTWVHAYVFLCHVGKLLRLYDIQMIVARNSDVSEGTLDYMQTL